MLVLIWSFKLWMDILIYTTHVFQKVHPKIPLTTLVLKYICNFLKLYDMYYIVTNIFYIFKFFIACWIFFLNAKRLYLWLQFLGGLVCFHPFINSDVPYIIGDQRLENLSLESLLLIERICCCRQIGFSELVHSTLQEGL